MTRRSDRRGVAALLLVAGVLAWSRPAQADCSCSAGGHTFSFGSSSGCGAARAQRQAGCENMAGVSCPSACTCAGGGGGGGGGNSGGGYRGGQGAALNALGGASYQAGQAFGRMLFGDPEAKAREAAAEAARVEQQRQVEQQRRDLETAQAAERQMKFEAGKAEVAGQLKGEDDSSDLQLKDADEPSGGAKKRKAAKLAGGSFDLQLKEVTEPEPEGAIAPAPEGQTKKRVPSDLTLHDSEPETPGTDGERTQPGRHGDEEKEVKPRRRGEDDKEIEAECEKTKPLQPVESINDAMEADNDRWARYRERLAAWRQKGCKGDGKIGKFNDPVGQNVGLNRDSRPSFRCNAQPPVAAPFEGPVLTCSSTEFQTTSGATVCCPRGFRYLNPCDLRCYRDNNRKAVIQPGAAAGAPYQHDTCDRGYALCQ